MCACSCLPVNFDGFRECVCDRVEQALVVDRRFGERTD